jgi:hypothetical protein
MYIKIMSASAAHVQDLVLIYFFQFYKRPAKFLSI